MPLSRHEALVRAITARDDAISKRSLEKFGIQESSAFVGPAIAGTQYQPVNQAQLQNGYPAVAMPGWNPQAAALPRPYSMFHTQAFGPGVPLVPMPIDMPDQISGKPQPRRSQYPMFINMANGQPGNEGQKLASFDTLRTYARINSLVRACIQLIKSEIAGLEYNIIPTPAAERMMRGNKVARADFDDRRRKLEAFWVRPDPNFDTYHSWFSAVLEEILTTDALSIYMHPTREPGMGLFGTDLAAMELIDGSTIKPIMDITGGTPKAPAVAYQQFIWGLPRVDLTDVIHPSDELAQGQDPYPDDTDIPLVDQFTRDQLLYLPVNPFVWQLYGCPPTEQALIPIVTFMRRQKYILDYFNEGSLPGAWIALGGGQGQGLTPTQAESWRRILNAVAGDIGYKYKVQVLPSGSVVNETHPSAFDAAALRAVQEDILMAFGVQPTEIGLAPGGSSSGLGGKGAHEGQENVQQRKNQAMLQFISRALFNYVMQVKLGQTDMAWAFEGMGPQEDEQAMADSGSKLIQTGMATIDEKRIENGLEPFGLPLTMSPWVMTSAGPMSLGSSQPDPAATDEASEASESLAPVPEEAIAPPAQAAVVATVENVGTAPGQTPQDVVQQQQTQQQTQQSLAMSDIPDIVKMDEELQTLRRYLKRGKKIESFDAEYLDSVTLNRINMMLSNGLGPAIGAGRKLVKSATTRKHRADVVKDLSGSLSSAIVAQVQKIKNPTKASDPSTFVTAVKSILTDHYTQAYTTGATDYDDGYEIDGDDTQTITDRVNTQIPFITAWGAALVLVGYPNSDAQDAQQADLYGQTVQPAYDEGYTTSWSDDAGDGGQITWNIDPSSQNCNLCISRDGQTYTMDTLPGYPGDGGFGEQCDGGPNCNCSLDYSDASGSSTFSNAGGE